MNKRTVLVVDDDPATRTLLAKLLSNNGCLVQTAEAGDIAMDIIFNDPPDAVLLNPDIPGVDLDTFKEALHKQNPLAKIALISAPAQPRPHRLHVLRAPFTDSGVREAVGHC
jgi:CheY-like chemotaxis protein